MGRPAGARPKKFGKAAALLLMCKAVLCLPAKAACLIWFGAQLTASSYSFDVSLQLPGSKDGLLRLGGDSAQSMPMSQCKCHRCIQLQAQGAWLTSVPQSLASYCSSSTCTLGCLWCHQRWLQAALAPESSLIMWLCFATACLSVMSQCLFHRGTICVWPEHSSSGGDGIGVDMLLD